MFKSLTFLSFSSSTLRNIFCIRLSNVSIHVLKLLRTVFYSISFEESHHCRKDFNSLVTLPGKFNTQFHFATLVTDK